MRDAVRRGTENLAAIEARANWSSRMPGSGRTMRSIRRADDLGVPADGDLVPLIALIAARAGSTRLIDNLLLAE